MDEFGCKDLSQLVCPLDTIQRLDANKGELFDDPYTYREVVKKLNFLTNKWTDLAFAIQHLSQFIHQLRIPHLRP